jgi:pyruvate/2-oxoglutarate dehydrogenase complex dihydrolipoamide dehydrogenase (E3) component
MAERSKTAIYAQAPRLEPEDRWNAALLAAVRPADWQNPPPRDSYHLVVVGAGTAGLVAASIAAGLGAKVALVERHLMGGDCLNTGCVPSKSLIAAARSWQAARRSAEDFGGPRIAAPVGDFALVMERLRRQRAEIAPLDGAERFRGLGVDVFFGHGRFVASDCLEVGGKRMRFRQAAIATGGRPALPAIPGLDLVPFLTSDKLFSLTELPARLAVIGGGPLGCEMAQSFARFGSQVHLFEKGSRLLPHGDAGAGELLARRFAAEGIHLHLGGEPTRAALRNEGSAIFAARQGGGEDELPFDQILLATGRSPNVEGLGLEAAGVHYDENGVEVDSSLRTSNKRIFALGDVASRPRLTHHADAQARLLIRNAFFFGRGSKEKLVVPSCVYTSPEVAQVGLTREEAARRGIAADLVRVEMADVDRARLEGESEGFLDLLVAKGKDRILGATLVAENAGDLIGQIALAIQNGVGLEGFGATIYPYPTRGEIFRKAADAWNRRRLTPRYKSWLETFFRIRS